MLLHVDVIDVPSLLSALKRLGWSLDQLAREARVEPPHLDALVRGHVYAPRSVHHLVSVVNDALRARGSA